MRLHREGYLIMLFSFLAICVLQYGNLLLFRSLGWLWLYGLLSIGFFVLFFLIVWFFRVPNRKAVFEPLDVLCPADGKIVIIEPVQETEYFNDQRIQVSVFMSPLNVHANYNPISGRVCYVKYHKGTYLVAWHPKSSTHNERSTFVVEHQNGQQVLFRQIAGAVARRICYYLTVDQKVTTGEEFGFIKFGSRIDLFLPLNAKINVKVGDKVQAKITKIAELSSDK